MASRRRWMMGVCLLLIAAGAIRLLAWQGLLFPVRVSGGSMAASLVGEHFQLTCRDCGFPCRYDAHDPPGDGRMVCPNCGFVNDHSTDAPLFRGQRAVIDRLAYRLRPPRRGDVVAFRAPDNAKRLSVKRIVGLPGERVQVRDGDLYIDGRLVRKSLAELRSVSLPVHDNDYRPQRRSDGGARWLAVDERQGWQTTAGRLRFQPTAMAGRELAWVAYQHWPCFAGNPPRCQPSPILDNYGYNQNVSRQLQAVCDVMLICRLQTPGRDGQVGFEVTDRGDVFRVTLDFPRRTGSLERSQRPGSAQAPSCDGTAWERSAAQSTYPVRFKLPAAAFARGVTIELALCDGQVLFAIDEQVLVQEKYTFKAPRPHDRAVPDRSGGDSVLAPRGDLPAETTVLPTARFQIGVAGAPATLERLRIARDIYYLDPAGSGQSWQAPRDTGPAEVFVVGDNVPISQDSRHWAQPGMPLEQIVGRVSRW